MKNTSTNLSARKREQRKQFRRFTRLLNNYTDAAMTQCGHEELQAGVNRRHGKVLDFVLDLLYN